MASSIFSKKRVSWGVALLVVLAVVAATQFSLGGLIASQQKKNDQIIIEQQAYHVGVMAYLYGYPLVDMYKQMHNETYRVSDDQQSYAPVNRFYQFPDLVTPTTSGNFRAPNNDTLYYTAWFDISEEPLIIHTPDTNGRYYTIAVTNQYSEVTHIGRRTFGTEQQYFALVPPHWQGELPEGVTAIPVETNEGWLLGRMLVDGKEDFAEAMALVNNVWLASLSEFNPQQRPPMPAEEKAQAIDPLDSLAFFEIMSRQMKSLPPRSGEAALIAMFNDIGVGPAADFDEAALDEATRNGLLRAIEDGMAIVQASAARTIPDFNGWMISKNIGRYENYPYMHRASVVKGGYGNLPEESLYPATLFDSQGDLLNGSKRYRLHFPAGQLPPVNGFWSLSVYNIPQMQLVENDIQRYSIGDRTDGIVYGKDGSLTIIMQHETPVGSEVNWLPTPAGNFAAILRFYEPAQAALDNSYLVPRIEELTD
jgi:hypothetical protein